MEKFAEYGFNKSHSAAYALVAWQTAWLKVHYPAEFMAAVFSANMDKGKKIVELLDEVRRMGLSMLPPDVNASGYAFEASAPATLRYGLGAIKGVGRGVCEAIIAARGDNGFTDLYDFLKRVDTDAARLNRRALDALVYSGALDALAENRASLMLQLPEVLKATEQISQNQASKTCPEWPLPQKLAGERETLGHYLSGHPLDPYREELAALIGHDLGQLDQLWANRSEAGLVTGVRKRGQSQAFVQLEDGRGQLECAFFNDTLTDYAHLLTRELTRDRIVIIEGGLREDDFSGGFSLRARRVWEFERVCEQHASHLALQLDLRVAGTLDALERLLAQYRPGPTPLRLELLLPRGAAGALHLTGSHGIRTAAALPGTLRALPGVRQVQLTLERPWAG